MKKEYRDLIKKIFKEVKTGSFYFLILLRMRLSIMTEMNFLEII